jgi:hypothetical protein
MAAQSNQSKTQKKKFEMLIDRITGVTFTLNSPTRATITAKGEVSTAGWTNPKLKNPRVADGILHLDFDAQKPEAVGQQVTPISADYIVQLAANPPDVTVHSQTNEMSVHLPPVGDGDGP